MLSCFSFFVLFNFTYQIILPQLQYLLHKKVWVLFQMNFFFLYCFWDQSALRLLAYCFLGHKSYFEWLLSDAESKYHHIEIY